MCYTLPRSSYTYFILMVNLSRVFTSSDLSTSLTMCLILGVLRSASQPKHCYECSVMVIAIYPYIFIGQYFTQLTSIGGFKQILGIEGNSSIATDMSVWDGVSVCLSYFQFSVNNLSVTMPCWYFVRVLNHPISRHI